MGIENETLLAGKVLEQILQSRPVSMDELAATWEGLCRVQESTVASLRCIGMRRKIHQGTGHARGSRRGQLQVFTPRDRLVL
jgi:hypothetical protein